jgi:hypothetical protein
MAGARGLPEDALREAEKFCVDEYEDYVVYKYLASKEKGEFKRILERLAEEEYRHYMFWSKVTGRDCAREVRGLKFLLIRLLRLIFGLTFTIKLMESHEKDVVEAYRRYLDFLEGRIGGSLRL